MQAHRHCTGRPGWNLNPEFQSEPMTSPRKGPSSILQSVLALISPSVKEHKWRFGKTIWLLTKVTLYLLD